MIMSQPKHLLITGFDPFGGESVNPAWEVVRCLPDTVGDYVLTKLEIPTVFGRAAETVLGAVEEMPTPPDVILCIGQARGRAAVTPEFVAINYRHAGIDDNAGNRPCQMPVIPDAPDAYFATVPVQKMTDAIHAAGIRAQTSYSAGTFVCNDVFYTLLHHFAGTEVRVGFIHVPFLPNQTTSETTPSMVLSDMICALTAAIEALE